MSKKIKKIFIANRGEIARRIAMSADKLGIRTVVAIGKNPPSYLTEYVTDFIAVEMEDRNLFLDQDRMIELSIGSGCDALHPGFGFLSENCEFARKVEEAGLTWIGPSYESIRDLGNKERAKAIAKNLGIPTLPALTINSNSSSTIDHTFILNSASEIEYPVIFKDPSAGGGRGMVFAGNEAELGGLLSGNSLALRNLLAKKTILMEKYLQCPRHIEVQVIGDGKGNIFTVGDRDCSIQRRFQKIIEEAPAPYLKDKTRRAMSEAAASLCRHASYKSAGTVEFLLESRFNPKTRELEEEFYFLEMNTRLQVEHTVTEEAYGIDLVELQIKAAEGCEFSEDMFEKGIRGNSIEARIYAEDINNSFFPAPGAVLSFVPYKRMGIRWEIGIEPSDEISPHFDPMIAKIIANGKTRVEAMDRLKEALMRTIYLGPPSNIGFLLAILNEKDFRLANFSTDYIKDHMSLLKNRVEEVESEFCKTGKKLLYCLKNKLNKSENRNETVFKNPTVDSVTREIFSRTVPSAENCDMIINHENSFISKNIAGSRFENGSGFYKISGGHWRPFYWVKAVNSKYYEYGVLVGEARFSEKIEHDGSIFKAKVLSSNDKMITPIPGKVVKVLVSVGDVVGKDQTVVVLESMKMQFEVRTPASGVIDSVRVNVGDQINADELLVALRQ
ncbi:MAG: hypothetical protein HQK54_01460 [Oligoflexales bacterium]|nr:hypothetical protein [Oligoflexales bacterium]